MGNSIYYISFNSYQKQRTHLDLKYIIFFSRCKIWSNDQLIARVISINEQQSEIPLKSPTKCYLYCLVMCIATVYSGYSLTLIPSTSTSALIHFYDIQTPIQTMISLLNGILPVGAMVGCIVLPWIMSLTNKKQIHYILLIFSIVECILSIIPSFQSLLISRFILGVLNAFYTSISAAYIKEIFPPSLRKPFGAIYSCGRILGILICYVIAQIFDYRQDETQHIVVFFGLSFLALIQAILIYLFLPHSPIEMINTNNQQQLLKSMQTLYNREDVYRAISQYKKKVQSTARSTISLQGVKLVNRKNLLSFHLALLRQFCGVTFIIIYARQIMSDLGYPLANGTPVIINSIQFGAGIVGVFLVSRLQRRKMVIYTTLSLAVIILVIGITDLLQQSLACLIAMTIFMVPCGACLTSVIWSYPSQLASPAQGKYASLISWAGAAAVMLIPPYILNAMPKHSAYPIFFFFALYLIVAFLINYVVLVEVEELKFRRTQLIRRQLLLL